MQLLQFALGPAASCRREALGFLLTGVKNLGEWSLIAWQVLREFWGYLVDMIFAAIVKFCLKSLLKSSKFQLSVDFGN
jgi:hypothetical protein